MKGLYTFLTILFWLGIAWSAFNFIIIMSRDNMPNNGPSAAGHVVGTILGAAVIPGIIYLIRHFVGKEIKK